MPMNLSMSVDVEAAELMEHFQRLTNEEAWAAVQRLGEIASVTEEPADADYTVVVGLIYCSSLSNALDLDVSSAVLGKLQTNEYRYPVDEFRGRFRRPERERDR